MDLESFNCMEQKQNDFNKQKYTAPVVWFLKVTANKFSEEDSCL